MYYYIIILFILVLLFINVKPIKTTKQIGGTSMAAPIYESIKLDTLDYNNAVFGKISNFSLNNNESFSLNINVNMKTAPNFTIDLLNNPTDTNYIFRINPPNFNVQDITVSSTGTTYTNNLNNLNSNVIYLKITPIKPTDVTDISYTPLFIDSLTVNIQKKEIRKEIKKIMKISPGSKSLADGDGDSHGVLGGESDGNDSGDCTDNMDLNPKYVYNVFNGGYITGLIICSALSFIFGILLN